MDALELIDDYFKGLLTDEQKEQFERKILSDPSFAEELAFYVSARDILKGQLTADKKARFKELYEQSKTLPSRQSPVRTMRTLAVAAVVMVAVFGAWWLFLRHPDPQQLADTYIRQNLLTLNIKMSSVQDSLQLAKSRYNDNDLPGALRLFEEIMQQNPKNSEAIISAGIVCLRLKDYDKALHYFQQLAADTALYINPALFYQSLTLMERHLSGDDQKARQLLQEVVDHNLAMKEQAQQWLNKW